MSSADTSYCGEQSCGGVVEKGIQCDRCLLWYHNACSRLDEESIALYSLHPNLKWICFHCVCLADTCSRLLSGEHLIQSRHVAGGQNSFEDDNVQRLNKAENLIREQGSIIEALRTKLDELHSHFEHYVRNTELAMGRQRNVLIYNREEPIIREAKVRRDMDRRRVQDILRMVGIPPLVGIKRIHRIGSWKNASVLHEKGLARPILVEFKNPLYRDLLLNRAGLLAAETNGRYQVAPDTFASRAKPLDTTNFGSFVSDGGGLSQKHLGTTPIAENAIYGTRNDQLPLTDVDTRSRLTSPQRTTVTPPDLREITLELSPLHLSDAVTLGNSNPTRIQVVSERSITTEAATSLVTETRSPAAVVRSEAGRKGTLSDSSSRCTKPPQPVASAGPVVSKVSSALRRIDKQVATGVAKEIRAGDVNADPSCADTQSSISSLRAQVESPLNPTETVTKNGVSPRVLRPRGTLKVRLTAKGNYGRRS